MSTNKSPKEFLTIEEAAKSLKVSVSLLQKLTADRSISSYRLGRRCFYKPAQLHDEFMARAVRPREGGGKGLSTLTEVNVRREVARIAGISEGTLWKVKKIEESGTEEQKKALREGKVTAR